jgi:hypothetical protein
VAAERVEKPQPVAGAKRRARPSSAPRVSVADRDRLKSGRLAQDVLLTFATSFLLEAGLPSDGLAKQLRTLARKVESGMPIRLARSAQYDLMVQVSGVVHDWNRDREYTDDSGEPRVLRSKGRQGLQALIRKRFPARSVARVLSWMKTHGVVELRGNDQFALPNRAVLVGGAQPITLERVVTLATQYLAMGLENLNEPRLLDRDLDRISRVFHLPTKYVSEFRAFSKDRAKLFLEEIDNWLEDRSAPRDRAMTVEAGVHAYGYVGPTKGNPGVPSGKSSRPTKRKP